MNKEKGNAGGKTGVDRDIILITGQPGINKMGSIKKIASEKEDGDIFIKPIDFEGLMANYYKEENLELINASRSNVIKQIITKSPKEQKRIWGAAFDKLAGLLDNTGGKIIYAVSLHATFYHQKLNQFISPIDVEKLSLIKDRVKCVLVFIDDCYDIYKRLIQKGGMFEIKKDIDPKKAAELSIKNNKSILYWREIEQAISNLIRQYSGVPVFTVAVKHPAFMIGRLFTKPLKDLMIFYLAHTISKYRSEYSLQIRSSTFPAELKKFAESILTKCKELVIFIPDTIDEYRFEIGKDSIKWLPPWPLPFGQEIGKWAFNPLPEELYKKDPIFVNGEVSKKRDREKIIYLFRQFADLVWDKITSYDLNLVIQSSDGIILYKPHWNGTSSRGAKDEADYNYFDLKLESGENKREMYVLEEAENIGKYRIRLLLSEIAAHLSKPKIKPEHLRTTVESWFQDADLVQRFFNDTWDGKEIRNKVEISLKISDSDYEFDEDILKGYLKGLPKGVIADNLAKQKHVWDKLEKDIKGFHVFKSYCDTPLDKYLVCGSDEFETAAVGKLIKKINNGK